MVMESGPPAQELETFIPADGLNGVTIFKASAKIRKDDSYDFVSERNNPHPTSDNDTLAHLLKAALGSGILAMPIAFKNAGLMFGVFATFLTAFICTHCCYILIQCAHKLYIKTYTPAMTFAEVAEVSFTNGPKWARGFAKTARIIVLQGLFWTYFGTCAVYTVIVAKNFQQVIEHYSGTAISLRLLIAASLVPLVLLCMIPNLKFLAPISMIANVLMALGLGITIYYLCTALPPISDRPYVGDFENFPAFFSITIFAMECIGVVMPLENSMKTPKHLLGYFGVLSKGMGGVSIVYMIVGFLGYWRYGDATQGSVTLNLPLDELPAQAVKIFIALAIFCTFGLQFYVCIEIVWNGVKDKFKSRPLMVLLILRMVLCTLAVLVAIMVPTIAPFIGLIGALCFSILGLLAPIAIEIITFWDEGFGPGYYRIWKNILCALFGLFALVFGSKSAIEDIIAVYGKTSD